jgi:hypothetical protein
VTLPACDRQRGTVAPGPGETPAELDAAGEVLSAVGDSVPLVEITLTTSSETRQRRTTGVVIQDPPRVLIDSAPLNLAVGEGEAQQTAHTRAIAAIFHPGSEEQRSYPASVVRNSATHGLALLALDGATPPSIPLSDDVADGARAYLISIPFGANRLAVQAGAVVGYTDTEEGRFVRHSSGHGGDAAGPLVNSRGELVGLQTTGGPARNMAVSSVEIDRWLRTPDPGELPPAEPGQVIQDLLQQMDVRHQAATDGDGYLLPRPGGESIVLRQTEGIVSAQIVLGSLHVGDAVEALRYNYSDPVGSLCLRPREGADELVWTARFLADAATAGYLSYVTRMAEIQAARWRQLRAGLDVEYPYEHYPGGEEDALREQLEGIIQQSQIPYEVSGEAFEMHPEADVSVFTNEFRGMAYVYAYSGGMPGDDASERERIARELVRRNWQLPLGRLALDKHRDLAWEAQVPMEHLSAQYLAALTRVCQDEVSRLKERYGTVPFNEE